MGLFSSSSELSEREDSSHSLISLRMVPCCWSRYIRDTSCTIVMFHRCCNVIQVNGKSTNDSYLNTPTQSLCIKCRTFLQAQHLKVKMIIRLSTMLCSTSEFLNQGVAVTKWLLNFLIPTNSASLRPSFPSHSHLRYYSSI